jgi:prepilin-type processing-associated H-X9-DG protein
MPSHEYSCDGIFASGRISRSPRYDLCCFDFVLFRQTSAYGLERLEESAMKKFLVVAAIALSCGAVIADEQAPMQNAPTATAQDASAQEAMVLPDLSAPEAAVRSYLDALNKGDLLGAAKCVAGTHFEGKLPAGLQQLQQGMRQLKSIVTIKNLRVETKGDNALAKFQVAAREPRLGQPPIASQVLPLRRERGVWKIAIRDPDTAMKSTLNKNQVFQGMAVFLLRPSMADAVFAGVFANARAASCRSNLRQLALAAFQLVQERDEVFAIKAAALQKSLLPYGAAKELFICPEDQQAALKGGKKVVSSYSFNANLEGVPLYKIKHPETTVMLYEGRGGKLNFRHKHGASVAFADGHVSMVTAKQAKALSWKP